MEILKQFLFNFVDLVNETKELKHCYPYEKNFTLANNESTESI